MLYKKDDNLNYTGATKRMSNGGHPFSARVVIRLQTTRSKFTYLFVSLVFMREPSSKPVNGNSFGCFWIRVLIFSTSESVDLVGAILECIIIPLQLWK